jgi:hypothetical protein
VCRFVIDGNKTIIQREEPDKKFEEVEFEPNEVYAVDICFSTGEGKVGADSSFKWRLPPVPVLVSPFCTSLTFRHGSCRCPTSVVVSASLCAGVIIVRCPSS